MLCNNMETIRNIELLAPAKNKTVGMAAIVHGADAVYIGADRFGARAAAGNSVADIAELCRFAHRYDARVYVTVNTVVYDNELDDTRRLIDELTAVGADAILLQDMGLVEYARQRIEIHASTQTDNRTAAKAEWLMKLGFSRVVLARELSLDEIRQIHADVPDVELEAFVHGALCVSYSGQCYASEYCFSRSANRGECAQVCRMKFTLENADGNTIAENLHLLSLKDMCRKDDIEQLMDAGVTSFKIEGRLKDVSYVKNVVAAYRQQIDSIIARHPDKYRRQSLGTCTYTFQPDVSKSFNRGFTTYFLHRREADIFQPHTPKALGEHVGYVKETGRDWFTVSTTATFGNGDGLCFFDESNELIGFRVNRAENNRLFPQRMPRQLKRRMPLYRNYDQRFEQMLLKPQTADRRIAVGVSLRYDGCLKLEMTLPERGIAVTTSMAHDYEEARTPQRDNIVRQLSKLGDTCFACSQPCVDDTTERLFIPAAHIASLRREAAAMMENKVVSMAESRRKEWTQREYAGKAADAAKVNGYIYNSHAYLYNIYNNDSRIFYKAHGVDAGMPATMKDLRPATDDIVLMQCRHCLRFSLGMCPNRKSNGTPPMRISRQQWREPVFLRLDNGRRFRLSFDCKNCQMNIYADN